MVAKIPICSSGCKQKKHLQSKGGRLPLNVICRYLFFSYTIAGKEKSITNSKACIFRKEKEGWGGARRNHNQPGTNPISNLELWFFLEFGILYNTYNIKPRVIPIKLLVNKHKTITGNKIKKSFTLSNEKKS